ncbi:MAG: serine/threonine protein kinase [Deltaproteobacteria bacterium]|nr:serine/threonine protein kinase [Deltaproteobacteria bacterium]MBW2384059.1 serine/threonine protein kinase [Deltaproteobacteria bacterium]MBW2697258.1 serine/threonine protein kinase [Deltaproteobacteria bacterium]
MDESEFFFRLSPDRVLQAVEAGGLSPSGHCFTLNALENRVYDVRLEDGRHVVAKFYRPGRWSREAILEEHGLLALLAEMEIPVAVPLAFEDGETLHRVEGIHYAVWPRTGGRSPDELDDGQVAVLGRLLARIHSAAQAASIERRPALDSEHFPLAALTLLEERGFLPPSCANRYRAAVEELVAIYDDWSRDVALHPIHGDCHRGNLLLGDAGWLFLDFDDVVIGPAVQDVWMLLPGRDAEAARQRALLVEAYREFRDFDERSLRLIEPLRAFRFVWYAGWIARRWDDPAFPDAFPHFGGDEYWENETRDLEQQVELIVRGEGASVPAPDAQARSEEREAQGELTNEDFFWDL